MDAEKKHHNFPPLARGSRRGIDLQAGAEPQIHLIPGNTRNDMKSCITCGMPLEGAHASDIGFASPEGLVCKFDSVDGAIKPADVIFEGGVVFFLNEVADGDRALAERLTRKNMKALPYWQAHPFALLDGDEATDEEFNAAMAKL